VHAFLRFPRFILRTIDCRLRVLQRGRMRGNPQRNGRVIFERLMRRILKSQLTAECATYKSVELTFQKFLAQAPRRIRAHQAQVGSLK